MTTPDPADGPGSARPAGPPTGTIAQEAGRLLDALQDWMADHAAAVRDDGADHAHNSEAHISEAHISEAHISEAHVDESSIDQAGAGSGDEPSAATDSAVDGSEHDGPIRRQVCQVCPICQLAGLLDGVRPDLLATLGETAVTLLAALRTAVDAQERQWASRRSHGVERIDIE